MAIERRIAALEDLIGDVGRQSERIDATIRYLPWTGGQGAVLLEIAEEVFGEIALAIQCEIGLSRLAAIGFRRDDGRNAPLLKRRDQSVRVIALVGEERFRLDLIEQRRRLRDVGRLTPGVSDSATGLPSASTMAWILVVNPPRDRTPPARALALV